MTKLVPVTRAEFGNKQWKRMENFRFAENVPLVALGANEVSQAMLHMALGFVPENDDFFIAAIVGLNRNESLFVDQSGNWNCPYIPSNLRTFPFVLAKSSGDSYILCFDEDIGTLAKSGGESFYLEDGEMSPVLKKALEFLVELEKDKMLSRKLCKLLDYHKVLEPWSIKIAQEDNIQDVVGLYRVSEKKINELVAEELAELREGGGLLLAYCQLLSMQHLEKLGSLSYYKNQQKKMEAQVKQRLSPETLAHGTISFENI